MTSIKYELPRFLEGKFTRQKYLRWLRRKANSLADRDEERWGQKIHKADYMQAIHGAMLRSEGRDAYTGEMLDWSLFGQYDNEDAQSQGTSFKRKFALYPTVDHANPESKQPDFRICGWRTNDCKSDLTPEGLIEFCEKVLRHTGRGASPGFS